MVGFYVYFAVIVSGASVLAIEILGTRIIGPFYGVSLYLWSALIGVTLAALSVGYAIGGRWADRGPRLSRFCSLLIIAGAWIVMVPWVKHPVLAMSEPLGLRAAVLVAATILFFPPLTLLGMVSPYAIRLKASSLNVVGRTAGNLYALSTVASVAAAIGTGFFLIPNMGVSRLTFLIGVALIATAVVGFATMRRASVAVPVVLVVAVFSAAAFAFAPAQRPLPMYGLLAVESSPYAEIRVVDKDDRRYMLIDGGTHTIVDPDNNFESHFPYVNVLDIAGHFFSRGGRMLLVGLGGGSVAKRFARAGWEVDVVEIDPVVINVAYEYFGLEKSEASVHKMDGRRYLNETPTTYDLIIMDAFGSSSIPFHLVTKEAFDLIESRLEPNGILAMNIEAVGWHDILVRSLWKTMSEVFQNVVVLPMAEPPTEIGNLVLMASHRSLELPTELPVPEWRFSAQYHRAHAWDNRFQPDGAGVPVLTDDMNPVDVWAERINLVARRGLHEYFGSNGLSW